MKPSVVRFELASHTPRASLSHLWTSPQQHALRRSHYRRQMPAFSLALLPAADTLLFSHDTSYPFRQEALFFHLFGDRTPLRPQVAPPSPADRHTLPLTCALFVKGECEQESSTLLFLPAPGQLNSADLLWGRLPPRTASLAEMTTSPADQCLDVTLSGREYVVEGNDVWGIFSAVRHYVTVLSTQKLALSTPDAPASSVAQRLRQLNPLPQLFLQYPLNYPTNGSNSRYYFSSTEDVVASSDPVAFAHPLLALIALVEALRTAVVASTPAVDRSSDEEAKATYCYQCAPLLPLGASTVPPQAAQRITVPPVCLTYAGPRWSAPGKTSAGAASASPVVKQHVRSAAPLGWRYRACKSPQQAAQHLYSATLTRLLFLHAFRAAAHSRSESDVDAAMEVALLQLKRLMGRDCEVQHAYVPVIASGPCGAVIHYTENNRVLSPSEEDTLVRVDAGVELCRVPTDCTRTFPLGFAQFPRAGHKRRKAYELLLRLQRQLLQSIVCGQARDAVAELHVDATRDLLHELGVGELGSTQTVTADHVRNIFCAHMFGHFIGIDIHEEPPPPRRGEPAVGTPLLGGMMHTVEPGLYFPPNALADDLGFPHELIPEELRGTGFQIEDDVLILPAESNATRAATGEDMSLWGLWTRRAYLDHLAEAHAEAHRFCKVHVGAADDPVSALLAAAAVAPDQLFTEDSPCYFHVHFRVEQRWSIFGFENARDNVAHDTNEVLSALHEEGSSSWYPFNIVVTTAGIPKDINIIERIMSSSNI